MNDFTCIQSDKSFTSRLFCRQKFMWTIIAMPSLT